MRLSADHAIPIDWNSRPKWSTFQRRLAISVRPWSNWKWRQRKFTHRDPLGRYDISNALPPQHVWREEAVVGERRVERVAFRGQQIERPEPTYSCRSRSRPRTSQVGRQAVVDLRDLEGRVPPWIGIGGCLAAPPLPHHRAYGSVPRRFDRVKLGRAHRFGEDRANRNSCCAAPVGPTGVLTFARCPWASRPPPPH